MNMSFGPSSPVMCYEETAFPGVKRVCEMVADDVCRVTGHRPKIRKTSYAGKQAVLIGTLGRSEWMDQLAQQGRIDASAVAGKWECFLFQLVEEPFPGIERALIIAGSDKRGTIYGLFHLSELLGVSPLVD